MAASAAIFAMAMTASLRAQAPADRVPVLAPAIAATLTAAGLPATAAQIRLPMPILAFSEAPEMDIRSAEMRPDGWLRLRLACRDAKVCMPFFVEVATHDRAEAMSALAGVHPLDSAPVAIRATGVTAGGRVTLQLTDDRMRLQFPAICIDTGAPGAEVRVASLDRKHVYRGVVVDRTTVKGGLD